MDIGRKNEIAQTAVLSISRHTDESPDTRLLALKRLITFCENETAVILREVAAAVKPVIEEVIEFVENKTE